MLFSLFTFPVALILCLMFSYPLISLKPKVTKINYFFIFITIGFLLGSFMPALITNNMSMAFKWENIFTYGFLGFGTSFSAWYYVHKYVDL